MGATGACMVRGLVSARGGDVEAQLGTTRERKTRRRGMSLARSWLDGVLRERPHDVVR